MIRYNYLKQVTPPAPFVYVTLQAPTGTEELKDVPAQVDCAADRTVIPARLITQLGLQQLDEILCQGLGGVITKIPSYLVRLAVQPFRSKPIEVLGSAGETHVLLGRDVLNDYAILLNGTELALEIAEPLGAADKG